MKNLKITLTATSAVLALFLSAQSANATICMENLLALVGTGVTGGILGEGYYSEELERCRRLAAATANCTYNPHTPACQNR
jgi:predicted esterase YcpF (UPF0227 family)